MVHEAFVKGFPMSKPNSSTRQFLSGPRLGLHGQLSTGAHPDLLTTATAAAIAITAQGGQDSGATTLLRPVSGSFAPALEGKLTKWAPTSYKWSCNPYSLYIFISKGYNPSYTFTRQIYRGYKFSSPHFVTGRCPSWNNVFRLLLGLFGFAHLLHWGDNQLLQAIKPEDSMSAATGHMSSTQRISDTQKPNTAMRIVAIFILPSVDVNVSLGHIQWYPIIIYPGREVSTDFKTSRQKQHIFPRKCEHQTYLNL